VPYYRQILPILNIFIRRNGEGGPRGEHHPGNEPALSTIC
jgi:hypothetical protein